MFFGCASVASNADEPSDQLTSNVNVEPSVNETLDLIIGSWKSPPLPMGDRYRIFQFNVDGSVNISLYSRNGDLIESEVGKWEFDGEKYITTTFIELINDYSIEEFILVDDNIIWHTLGRNFTRE